MRLSTSARLTLANSALLAASFSALLLLVTMVRQVWSQWSSGAVGGISRWLFVGQVAASVDTALFAYGAMMTAQSL